MTSLPDRRNPAHNNNGLELGHFGEDRILPKPSIDTVTDEVRSEVVELQNTGMDIALVDVDMGDHYQLDSNTQELVNQAIETYSQIPEFARLIEANNPAVSKWLAMAKMMSPLSLTFFYDMKNMDRPSDGIPQEKVLHGPLAVLDGMTAAEKVIEMKGQEKAAVILDRVNEFFAAGSLKDGFDEFGLSAHDIMAGSLDRIGDITRAVTASDLVFSHFASRKEQFLDRGIVSASFACGAAEPVYWLLDRLRKFGIPIDSAHLIDIDPIALAATNARSEHYNLEDKVRLHHKDLVFASADSYIDPHSVDVVDIIGFIEYLKPPVAVKVLKNARSIVKPGGVIVFGNMVNSRPQQKWFDGLWPPLQQRSITEMIEIIEKAGFPREWLKIRLSKDGLYPIYMIEIPLDLPEPELGSGEDKLARELARTSTTDSLYNV